MLALPSAKGVIFDFMRLAIAFKTFRAARLPIAREVPAVNDRLKHLMQTVAVVG